MLRKRLLVVALAVVVLGLASAFVLVASGRVFYDSSDPDFGRLFTDVAHATGAVRDVRGTVTGFSSYELEPGFLTVTVRIADGSTTDIVLNESTRIIWPGSTVETAAAGEYGQVSPHGLARGDLDGKTLVGICKTISIGPLLHRESQVFLVRGSFE